ncbi:O-antigen ligase family protein [Aureimonas sp. ME7]|uniref:O-antigen ligase family protein n=1 Tax=Aureimonas sp. ME7 TaxID=2744252 RepID=UPI0015F541BC|nr:O-antigen ligase family protein [Aureimonas sp. ME7]
MSRTESRLALTTQSSPFEVLFRGDLVVYIMSFFLVTLLFKPRWTASSSIDDELIEFSSNADASIYRQLIFIALFLTTVVLYLAKRGVRMPRTISLLQLATISWMLVSFSWSDQPAIAFRRAVLMAMVALIAALLLDVMGVKKAFKTLYLTFSLCIFLSYLSLPLPYGIHPGDEIDVALIGNWKGIFFHKNIAGAVMGAAVIFFFYVFLIKRRWRDLGMLALAALFLYKTQSKTPHNLLIPSLACGLTYWYFCRNRNGRPAFLIGAYMAVGLLALIVTMNWDVVERVFNDPQSFSGRVAIWEVAVRYIIDNPWLGAGFNSFWGVHSADYVTSRFTLAVGHAHSGYIEVLATTGIIGLGLAVCASILAPIRQILFAPSYYAPTYAMLASLMFFFIFENFFEAQFYNIDKEAWSILMITVFITRLAYVETQAEVHAERLEYKRRGRIQTKFARKVGAGNSAGVHPGARTVG